MWPKKPLFAYASWSWFSSQATRNNLSTSTVLERIDSDGSKRAFLWILQKPASLERRFLGCEAPLEWSSLIQEIKIKWAFAQLFFWSAGSRGVQLMRLRWTLAFACTCSHRASKWAVLIRRILTTKHFAAFLKILSPNFLSRILFCVPEFPELA